MTHHCRNNYSDLMLQTMTTGKRHRGLFTGFTMHIDMYGVALHHAPCNACRSNSSLRSTSHSAISITTHTHLVTVCVMCVVCVVCVSISQSNASAKLWQSHNSNYFTARFISQIADSNTQQQHDMKYLKQIKQNKPKPKRECVNRLIVHIT